MMKVKYYNCPICKKKYKTLSGWGEHMKTIHPESIPEGYSISRYFYYIKTGKTAGKCRTCGKPTPWNEQSMKYDQYCTNPECKKAYVRIAKQRMIDTYGKVHLLDDPEHQKKMLENRKISGKYRFPDGTEFGYVGNYEKNFLEMMDKLMSWHTNDLMAPSPHTYYYDYKNSKDKDNEGRKFYIPDFYIPSLNLEIEIKQQTSTNQAYNDINKVKEKQKDEIMKKNPNVNYLKINDNNFAPFFQFLMDAKEQIPTTKEELTGQNIVAKESFIDKPITDNDVIRDDNVTVVKDVELSDITERWSIVQKDKVEHTCIRLKNDPRVYRARSEMLVIKNGEIFLNFKKDGEYSLPGGGWNRGEDPVNAAIREVQEEIRVNVKNVKYGGNRIWEYDGPTDWMIEQIAEKDWWNACFCTMFIGEYNGSYDGFVKKEDRDEMLNTGHFYKIGNVFDKLRKPHQDILKAYYNGPFEQDAITIESNIHPSCECFGACGQLNYEKIGCSDCPYGVAIESEKVKQPLSYSDVLAYCQDFNYNNDDYYVSGDSALVLRGLKEYTDNVSLAISETLYKQMQRDKFKFMHRGRSMVTNVNDRVTCYYNSNVYDVDTDYINGERVEKLETLGKKYDLFFDYESRKDAKQLINGYLSEEKLSESNSQSVVIEQAEYSQKNRYPVFIILQHTGTPMANVIKSFTKDEFSHACISFDSKLSKIYSFGNKKLNSLDPGFVVKDGPNDPFYKRRKTYYSVYVMYVDEISYKKMKEKLQFFIDNKDDLKYDLLNLLSCWVGRPSEESKKYFCSRFVMTVIGNGQKLSKLPSLYRPQELSELDNISLVNHGTDFSKYSYKLTEINLNKIKEGKFSEISTESKLLPTLESSLDTNIESTYEVATEGFFDLFKKKELITSWKRYLFEGKGAFGGRFEYKYIGARILDGKIEIRGINYTLLKNRIKRHYEDKSIYNIFIPKYNAMSYKRFEKKRIQRSEIKIDYLYTEEFFALELATLFTELGKRFRDKSYKAMAAQIYEESWLSKADKDADVAPLLDTTNLKNLRLELNDYQEDFLKRYPKLKAQLNLNGYILAFEQGLGKTLTAVGLAECLDVDHVYIVCPNSLKENWALEIQKYYEKYDDDDTWRSEVFICSDKPMFFNENTTKFMIINNESIQKMYPYVMRGKNLLILDESHNFRNLDSKRVQQLLELRDKLKCKDTLVMSGTPIKATPAELVPALLMIDPTFTMDAARIFTKAFKLHSALGTSLVQTRFGKVIYRKEKDVLKDELPKKHVEPLMVSINDKSKYTMDNVTLVVMNRFSEIYDSGYKEFQSYREPFLKLSAKYASREMDTRRFVNIITQIVKKDKSSVHEIDLMYVEDYMKKIKEKIKNKKDKEYYDFLIKNYVRYRAHCLGLAFGEILPPYRRDMYIAMYEENKDKFISMINDNPKKSLIFTQFKGVANYIYHSLNDNGVGSVMITGDVKNRMEILKEFKENPSIMVLIATSQTIGTGVTLTEANQMFFFGPPWRDSDFEQCSDRIHRIGQTDDCYIYTVSLDTGEALNLSTRMDDILRWSKTMTDAAISKTKDNENIDQTEFAKVLAQESSLGSEFLSIPDSALLIIRPEIKKEEFDDYIETREVYMRSSYIAKRNIPKGTIVEKGSLELPNEMELKDDNLKRTIFSKELSSNVMESGNLDFEEYPYVDFMKSWDLVTTTDIPAGSELILTHRIPER